MKFIRELLGYEYCIVCGKWTKPSITYGAICSIKCLKVAMGDESYE